MVSDKNFFEQLNSKTIGDLEAETVQALSNPVHLQQSNKELLQAIILVNKATMREYIPMPDQGKDVQTSGDADRIQFRPNSGEVWKLCCGDILETAAGTFTVGFQLRDSDGNIAFIGTSSSTG